ncbi:MAG: hypothetical protein FWC26_00925 [Fibromonadales bacterium]|nr:hypothetical protein [Fibromonadales bacterium]
MEEYDKKIMKLGFDILKEMLSNNEVKKHFDELTKTYKFYFAYFNESENSECSELDDSDLAALGELKILIDDFYKKEYKPYALEFLKMFVEFANYCKSKEKNSHYEKAKEVLTSLYDTLGVTKDSDVLG